MRWILARAVLAAFLAVAISALGQGFAQGNGPEDEAAEFAHLLKGLSQSRDPTVP